ncbi:MAG: hypothetical protein GC154_06800 [bacterium]|nr:hypothetical protein [bacterium]
MWIALFLFGLAGAMFAPAGWAEEADGAVADATGQSVFSSAKLSGSLSSTYYFRERNGDTDNDFYNFFSARLDDVVKDRVDVGMSFYWHEDLDGTTGSSKRWDPFLDIDQAGNEDFRLFTAYMTIKQLVFDDSYLRVGRQYLEDIDNAHFDGATYYFSPVDKLGVTLFGGVPVAFYSDTDGDLFYGASVDYRFSDRSRAAVRYYRYDAEPFQDDLLTLEMWNQIFPWLMSHDEFSLLNGEPYIYNGDIYARCEAIDLDVMVKAVHMFATISDSTINFNPYFPLLNSYEPFDYISLYMVKGVSDLLSLTGGVDYRQAEDSGTVTETTNRDYWRGTVGVEIYPTKQLTLSANAEFWNANPNDEFTGFSGEIEYRPAKQWTLTAGAEYGEYVQEYRDEFLLFFGEERVFRITPDVITYYASVKWQPCERAYTKATFEYEVEDGIYDNDEWFAFRLQAGVNF